MRKVGFITENKMLLQCLAAALQSGRQVDFELVSIDGLRRAELTAEVLGVDIAAVDANSETDEALRLCERLRTALPQCKILLLIRRQSEAEAQAAADSKRSGLIDDFLFYDATLDYLIAKLSSL